MTKMLDETPRTGHYHDEISQNRVSRIPQFARILASASIDAELFVVGDGERATWLRGELDRSGLRHYLLGKLPRAAVLEVFARTDLQLLVSDSEGTPLSMLEAMACGCVPVVPAIAGVLDVVRHGENGFVYPVGDMHAVAEIVSTLAGNREQLVEIRERARQTIIARFGIHRHIDDLIDLLRCAASAPIPSPAEAQRALWDRRLMEWATDEAIHCDRSAVLRDATRFT